MKKLHIGLLGYGTVGKGVETLLEDQKNTELLAIFRRSGKATIPPMSDRIENVIDHPLIDTIVEAMGGLEPAHTYLKQALVNGRNVVTSNKALVNAFGDELNALAIKHHVSFLFSAACGGGIPVLPTMVEALNQAPILSVGGILNGTTNFIIDKMEREDLPFEEALKQAQELGYAEADPTGDLNGTDTMYKLRLAMAVGLRTWIDLDSIALSGISSLKAADIAVFRQRYYALRLICFGQSADGRFSAYVEPTLVDQGSLFASIVQNNNLAWFRNSNGETTILQGQGAGSLPTATNVLRDLTAIQFKTQYFLSDPMTYASAENAVNQHAYYVRTLKKVKSAFLDRHQSEVWEDRIFTYRITVKLSVSSMHEAMKSLQEQDEVFFAGINPGGQL